jgi:hypothetical protein
MQHVTAHCATFSDSAFRIADKAQRLTRQGVW